MRQKCGKQFCPFPRAHQEVQTACDLSIYATCFSVGNLAVTFCRPSRLLLIWCWLDVVHLKPRVFSLEADSWHLRKKTGGIRPIAVGFTLRCLASKCASTCGASRLSSCLSPRQLGVGVPGRCEAAIHSARRYLETLPSDHVSVKLDFSNAFNSLHRSDMLRSVADRIPDLYALLLRILPFVSLVPWSLFGLFPRGPPTGGSVRTTALLQHNPSVTLVSRSKPQPWLLGRLITNRTGKRCGRHSSSERVRYFTERVRNVSSD